MIHSPLKGSTESRLKRIRLDLAVLDQGLASSRERARALILAGRVLVGDRVVDKAGALIAADSRITLRTAEHPYVGRGGVKLQGALETFGVTVGGRICLDLGASTGGFTDCLLRHGAARVYAVDVGRGQLDPKLRTDPRVVVMERTHARTLTPADFQERPELVTVDLSFISFRKVLPVLPALLAGSGEILALLKPQFEVGKGGVGKGGVVRDPEQHRRVIATVGRLAVELGLRILGAAPSCLLGPKGNREFFIHLACSGTSPLRLGSAQASTGLRAGPSTGLRAGPSTGLRAGLDPDLVADLAVGACHFDRPVLSEVEGLSAQPEPSRRKER